ncbi:MAG: tRNA (adenosine(37)-N6)-dimethylallyltransferase MiaA [Desulfonatronovibrionaceae bacterium]
MPAELVCIAGPTGSGKNDLALKLSRHIDLEIINFDSRQVYADLPIVTAQPGLEDQKLVPHHMYGFLGLWDRISAGAFVDRAVQKIAEVRSRGAVPFLVGGTGLYLRALIYGLADIPRVPGDVAAAIDEKCKVQGVAALRQELLEVDPEYCSRISSKDRQKMARALGVYRATGIPFSQWHRNQNQQPRYRALMLGIRTGLERLGPFLEMRINKMIEQGAVEEVKSAWDKCGRNPDCPAFSGIGCKELVSWLRKEADFDQAKKQWLTNTRAYAKRQLTWFAREKDLHWLDSHDDPRALNFLREQGLM